MHRSLAIVPMVACGLFVPATNASAETITVCASGCDHTSINAAIDAASHGDVIDIAAGTYHEHSLNPGGKSITIRGTLDEDGSLATTIDAQQGGSVFVINSGEGDGTVIEDLVLTGGIGDDAPLLFTLGGGIYCKDSSPTIRGCTITDNEASAGGGIYTINGSPAITECTVTGNTAVDGVGAGIHCVNGSPVITDCTISTNAAGNKGGGLTLEGGAPTVSGCTISDNTADNAAGGIDCDRAAATITGCTITGNAAAIGGGLQIFWCDPVITGCTLSSNTASEGGGVYCAPLANPSFVGCRISENTGSSSGGGLFIFSGTSLGLEQSDVCGNSSPQISGDYQDGDGNCIADSCDDANEDGVLDECEPCPGDVDGDGMVDGADLATVLGYWGSDDPTADLDGDGDVSGADLAYILGYWGACTTP